MPCASGEKAMMPIPSSPQVSTSSGSIQRLIIEYDGWWISSGVPRARAMSCASRVRSGE
jgi:hypothetical protein